MPTTPSTPDAGGTTALDHFATLDRRTDAVAGGHRTISVTGGDFETLETKVLGLKVGLWQELFDGAMGLVSAATLVREPGNRGKLTVTWTDTDDIEFWGLEMAEINKPIKTWKADDATDPPDLAQISRWEYLRNTDIEAYLAYKWDGAAKMSGNTLKLAQMIHEDGISYYTIHTPIAYRRTQWSYFPEDLGAGLDRQCTLSSRSGWTCAGDTANAGGEVIAGVSAAASVWIKTMDRVVTNADGTFTRHEQWTGADSVNEDLYPAEGAK